MSWLFCREVDLRHKSVLLNMAHVALIEPREWVVVTSTLDGVGPSVETRGTVFKSPGGSVIYESDEDFEHIRERLMGTALPEEVMESGDDADR